jgi:hypothetical protein
MEKRNLIIEEISATDCGGSIGKYGQHEKNEGKDFYIQEQPLEIGCKEEGKFTVYISVYTLDQDDEYEPIEGWHHDDFNSIEDALKFIWESEC